MATTTVPDIAALVPEVFASDTIDAFWQDASFAQYAEQVRDLAGARPGQVLNIGSFAGSNPALNLAETEEIVPRKLTATKRSFTVGRIGDSYEYSYASQTFSPQSLQAKSTQYLGRGFAERVDMNLTAAALTAVPAGRTITSTGTGAAAVMTVTDFINAVKLFPGQWRRNLVAVVSQGQADSLAAAVQAGGTSYQGSSVWQDGQLNRFWGVPITVETRLAQTTAGRVGALFFIPNRTFVVAPAVDPFIEFERFPKKATIDVTMNAWWAGGVQEPATLAVVDSAA